MLPVSAEQAKQLAEGMKDSPAYKFFVEHAGLPDVLRNKAAQAPRWVQWMEHYIFRYLGLTWVSSDYSKIEGKDYYRITIRSPFRVSRMVMTPLGAYFIHNIVEMAIRSGLFHVNKDMILSDPDSTGDLLMPMWAVPRIDRELHTILQDNEERIRFLIGEFQRTSLVAAKDEDTPESEAAQLPERVLH